jgi:hypothetical protein
MCVLIVDDEISFDRNIAVTKSTKRNNTQEEGKVKRTVMLFLVLA